jgi:polysaccharide biosynthesis protein PelC
MVNRHRIYKKLFLLTFVCVCLAGCASPRVSRGVYVDENMDFGAVETVAVMPFLNLSRETLAAERVRDVLISRLLATGALYVLPAGEVARGIVKAGITNPTTPSSEEIIKLGKTINVQAVITGVVREYGELRSSTTAANSISLSIQMVETETGHVVWSSSSTEGGISLTDRLFGGGGQPMEKVTEQAVDALIKKLFEPSAPQKQAGPAEPAASPVKGGPTESSIKTEKGKPQPTSPSAKGQPTGSPAQGQKGPATPEKGSE